MSILQPRRLALALLATVAAAPALAGGFAQPVATPVVAPVAVTPIVVAPSGEWTGGFVGAQLGFGDFTDNDVTPTLEGTGATFGLNAGYNRDFGRFVLGGEVQFDGTSISADNEIGDVNEDVDSVFRAGVRAGYDAGRFLPYVTGGYASAAVDLDALFADGDLTGGYLGAGVDYKLSDRIVLGVQVLRHDFDEAEADDGDSGDADVEFNTISLRATYNF